MNTKEHTTSLGQQQQQQQQQKYVDRDKAQEALAHTLTPRQGGFTVESRPPHRLLWATVCRDQSCLCRSEGRPPGPGPWSPAAGGRTGNCPPSAPKPARKGPRDVCRTATVGFLVMLQGTQYTTATAAATTTTTK